MSTRKGDNGGASYGTYQLSSKMGTLAKFLAQSPYGAQFAGLAPGSPEFNAKWKEIAKTDLAFGGTQHDFMNATHFDPALKALKHAGIDLSNQGPAVHDALWSTATQFGPGSAKKGDGAFGIFSKALAGKDALSMSQSDIVAAVQNYKSANNGSLFRSSSAAVQAGTMARAANEKGSLLRLAAASSVAGVAPSSLPSMPAANVPSSVPSEIPRAPDLKEPPERLNTGAGAARGDAIRVSLPEQTGQNVGDRGIAHIVGGGLGANF